MQSEGKTANFVFFDLSKLDVPSAAAFLADQAQRGTAPAVSAGVCHWIVGGQRGADLLATAGLGPEYLRHRLASGDRLLATNPTGADWNQLFPSEAEQDCKALEELFGTEVFVFLTNTPRWPGLTGLDRPVYRASSQGLFVHQGDKAVLFPWASQERKSQGVWWIVPGQVLFSRLPAAPWSDLPAAVPALLAKAGGTQASEPQIPGPLQKEPMIQTAIKRRSPISVIDQNVLFHPADYPGLGTKEAVDFEEALGGIRKRSLVANMQGQTDMAEQGFKVRFRGGRLVRIEDAAGTALCTGTETYLDWGGKRHSFTVNSAFSFEGDYSWGLRQSLVLNHDDLAEPGRAILDYYFVEESREFFVAVTVRWPRWKAPVTVSRWAPLEISLFDRAWVDPLTTRVVWPDGRSTDKLHRRSDTGVLAGTDFLFSAGKKSLVLGFPQNQTPRPHLLPWRLVPGWGQSRVVVCPEGGHEQRPSSDFDGVEEHFTFYMTPAEGAKLPFSVTRKQAIELIPPYVINDADAPSHS